MSTIPFQTVDWSTVDQEEHKGEQGTSFWQTITLDGLRVRIVEYSAGYLADHWCRKGHVVYCLEGSFRSELQDAEAVVLSIGMSYIVSDELSVHRSTSIHGAKLLIIDGDFLKP